MFRRDFFGVIAAPLLRHVGSPPVPTAADGKPLTVESLKEALGGLARMRDSGVPIGLHPPLYLELR